MEKNILIERSKNSERFDAFIQAIFKDYDSDAIDRNQAVSSIRQAFALMENGNELAAIDWINTGRKKL